MLPYEIIDIIFSYLSSNTNQIMKEYINKIKTNHEYYVNKQYCYSSFEVYFYNVSCRKFGKKFNTLFDKYNKVIVHLNQLIQHDCVNFYKRKSSNIWYGEVVKYPRFIANEYYQKY